MISKLQLVWLPGRFWFWGPSRGHYGWQGTTAEGQWNLISILFLGSDSIVSQRVSSGRVNPSTTGGRRKKSVQIRFVVLGLMENINGIEASRNSHKISLLLDSYQWSLARSFIFLRPLAQNIIGVQYLFCTNHWPMANVVAAVDELSDSDNDKEPIAMVTPPARKGALRSPTTTTTSSSVKPKANPKVKAGAKAKAEPKPKPTPKVKPTPTPNVKTEGF